MGSCPNYGPFLGTLNIRCRTIIRTQRGTRLLTTTHMGVSENRGPQYSTLSSRILVIRTPKQDNPYFQKPPI